MSTNANNNAWRGFLSQGYIRQIIRERKLLRQVKDTLRDNPEKHNVKSHP